MDSKIHLEKLPASPAERIEDAIVLEGILNRISDLESELKAFLEFIVKPTETQFR